MNPINLANANDLISSMQPVVRRLSWMIVTVFLLGGYLLVNFVLPGSGNLGLYILQPVLWLTIAFLALWLCSCEGERVNVFEHRSLLFSAALLGGIQVAVSILLGFLTGFGRSPYSHAVLMI